MQQKCTNCGQTFEITSEDLAFYDKISPMIGGEKQSLPPPTHCPDCRQQRRLSFRNERTLYHRKCDLSGKQIISNFAADAKNPVYAFEEWWSDKWDARTYGKNVDLNRSFFEQLAELQAVVPQLALSVWNSENSDYCNYVGNVKNSYLIFGSVYSEDCYYGSPYYSRNAVDTLVVRKCERCYECIDCRELYECFWCRDCHSSQNLLYCYDLQGCHDCIGCAGLRKKNFCILNEQYDKEEYEKRKKELDLSNPETHQHLSEALRNLSLQIPHRFMQSGQTENVSGNYVYESKNVHNAYYADRCEDCRYCAQVVDLKDCYDNNFTEENELCYEYLGAYQNQRLLFSRFCNRVSDSFCCDACFASKNLFGCTGIRNGEYCILNKQYTKEEYQELVPKIIASMQASKEWGEFLPTSMSPFGYNETVAHEYFPLSEKEATKHRWKWKHEQDGTDKYLGPVVDVPRDPTEADESICKKVLLCQKTGRPYKLIPQELAFYKALHIPIPRVCPDQRHKERMSKRNPRHLWKRNCAKCSKTIETTYAPERPEIVYCDECYLKEVY